VLLFWLGGETGRAAPKDFRSRIRWHAQESTWTRKRKKPPLTRSMLVTSVEGARAYLLNHQKPEGNFNYAYDIVLNQVSEADNPVRQAGALWALASLCRDRPTSETRHAAIRGLDFFFRWSKPVPSGHIAPTYPGTQTVKTGMVALTCLAITDFCRGQKTYVTKPGLGLYKSWLRQYLGHLESMELDNGSWGSQYLIELRERDPEPSAYYDGECLLAYCRAARYMGFTDLIPKIEKIARQLAERYTVEAWDEDFDSDEAKAFLHWGCMAFAEYAEAGWKDADLMGEAALALVWWAVHGHYVHLRKGNTAYAVEGMMAAYRIAQLRNDRETMARLRTLASDMLQHLLSMQVGSPLQDKNLPASERKSSKWAHGGVVMERGSGMIRIDVVQHQLNASLMALDLLFPEGKSKGAPPSPRGQRKRP